MENSQACRAAAVFVLAGMIAAAWAVEPGQVYEAGQLHLESSRVYVHVGKTGFGHEHGVVGMIKQGEVYLGGSESGEIVFDMTTFTADTDAARKYVGLAGSTDESTRRQVNENMLGGDVLDVRRFPTAVFKIKRSYPMKQASSRGLTQYQLTGDFTLHGVTRPIEVLADVEERGPWLHLRGGFTILQSDYGIKPYTKAFGAVGVADKLQIWGDLWLSKDRQFVPAAQR